MVVVVNWAHRGQWHSRPVRTVARLHALGPSNTSLAATAPGSLVRLVRAIGSLL